MRSKLVDAWRMTGDPARPRTRLTMRAITGIGLALCLSVPPGPGGAPVSMRTAPSVPAAGAGESATVVASSQVYAAAVRVAAHATVASSPLHQMPGAVTPVGDVPQVALFAYQAAAAVMTSAKPGCHLDWSVLAAVGQVESDHGRAGGATLRPDGTSLPSIRGPVLDGSGGRARVNDSDQGRMDGDARWDRALGPMQLLPTTWIATRVDGDGDGVRSPDDIDDASLAAAVFLCVWGVDLASASGLRSALHHFDPSARYATGVASLAADYRVGDYAGYSTGLPGYDALWVASGTGSEVPLPNPKPSPAVLSHGVRRHHKTSAVVSSGATAADSSTSKGGSTGSAGSAPGSSGGPVAAGDTPGATSGSPSPGPGAHPSPEPAPDPPPPVTPSPTVAPVTMLAGTLQSCGDGGYCVDGTRLGLGSLQQPADFDYDGDGGTFTLREELDGLLGKRVTVRIDPDSGPEAVASVNGLPWP